MARRMHFVDSDQVCSSWRDTFRSLQAALRPMHEQLGTNLPVGLASAPSLSEADRRLRADLHVLHVVVSHDQIMSGVLASRSVTACR